MTGYSNALTSTDVQFLTSKIDQWKTALILNYGFLVSKETVVRRRWGDQNKNLVLSNELIKVELPP